MIEWRHILTLYQEAVSTSRNAALATVVQIQGSSYRSTGSRMLILDDGRWAGTISGGCLEKDARHQANRVMAFKEPTLIRYDASKDTDQVFMARLGCNGTIDVLFEPLIHNDPNIEMLTNFLHWEKSGALAKVYSSEDTDLMNIGARMLLQPNGQVEAKGIDKRLENEIFLDLQSAIKVQKSYNRTYTLGNKSFNVLIELIQPTLHLYVFGSGYDVHPLLNFAREVGWHSTISITQKARAKHSFYPSAHQVKYCEIDKIRQQFTFSPYSAAVVMCHNYEMDYGILEQLVQTEIPFIGLLGPKKRAEEMLEQLNVAIGPLNKSCLNTIHAPVGLDLGSEGPVEIALSVIAEILADFKGHSGGFLKDRAGPIHNRGKECELVLRNHYIH